MWTSARLYEVRVYAPDNTLKKIISKQEIIDKQWKKIRLEYSIPNKSTVHKVNLVPCSECPALFELKRSNQAARTCGKKCGLLRHKRLTKARYDAKNSSKHRLCEECKVQFLVVYHQAKTCSPICRHTRQQRLDRIKSQRHRDIYKKRQLERRKAKLLAKGK